jgi:hypothetical protein
LTGTLRHATIGAVNEEVNVADRIVNDSVAQGSYNYAETVVKGLPARAAEPVSVCRALYAPIPGE